VEKFITACLEPRSIEWITFSKNDVNGTWDFDCDKAVSAKGARELAAALEWFEYHLDRFGVTDYCLRNLDGTAWQTVCVSQGTGDGGY
jgi:hypothetical protein